MAKSSDVEKKAMLARITRLRMDQNKSKSDDESDSEIDLVTLMKNKCGGEVYDPSKSSKFSSAGFQFARSRGRRKSKEFEDLLMHTATGNLHFPQKGPNFLRPKTSSTRDRPSGHSKTTGSDHSFNSPSTRRRLHRSVSDIENRVPFSDNRTHPQSPGGRSHLKEKHPISPLASPTLPRSRHHHHHK